MILCLLIAMFIIVVFIWSIEKILWNKGICKQNKLPWLLLRIDSQGSRVYKAGDHYIIITWPFIDGR